VVRRRFAAQRWAILTPERSVRWTPAGERLEFRAGVPDAPAHVPHRTDASCWLARSIFDGR